MGQAFRTLQHHLTNRLSDDYLRQRNKQQDRTTMKFHQTVLTTLLFSLHCQYAAAASKYDTSLTALC
jgi:hypothetical protein